MCPKMMMSLLRHNNIVTGSREAAPEEMTQEIGRCISAVPEDNRQTTFRFPVPTPARSS